MEREKVGPYDSSSYVRASSSVAPSAREALAFERASRAFIACNLVAKSALGILLSRKSVLAGNMAV